MGGYYLENFGCRATQADGAAIERDLLARGLVRAGSGAAEVAVLNTCTVTAAADADARAAIRRIHRENPECKILVTGCYAQRAPEEIAQLPGVSWVVGNSHKTNIAAIATAGSRVQERSRAAGEGPLSTPISPPTDFVSLSSLTTQNSRLFVSDIFAHTELLAAPVFENGYGAARTRPNLKVQDGCDNRCSFCVIPYVRGQSRSLALGEVLHEIDELVRAGYKEVVLSGINLGRWGRDLGAPMRFEQLVATVLERTRIERLRISSVEPMDWSDELVALVAGSPRIAKHAHVPLQSGSDRVLRRMHRKYRPWHYAEKLRKLRAAMPEAAIGADVMTGFPGETDEQFEESRRFIAEQPFTYLHVFTYSARPGTPAAEMPGQVPGDVARERNRTLRALAAEKNLAFRESLIGKTIDAITLERSESDFTEALSSNYIKLRVAGAHEANQLVCVRVTGPTDDGLTGETA